MHPAIVRFRKRFSARRSRAGVDEKKHHELEQPGGPADVLSVRAKSMRHGKSTADKWNRTGDKYNR